MQTRKLGNSDLQITPVGYGAWAAGGSGWQFAWGSQDDQDLSLIHIFKLIVFDIAGTIIEDHGEVVSAFSAAFEKSGIPFTKDELRRWKGASKRETCLLYTSRCV